MNWEDDDEIPDDAVLWRRVPAIPSMVKDREGEIRPSSAAFSDSTSPPSPMSVAFADILKDPQVLIDETDLPCGVVAITVKQIRELGLRVKLDRSGKSYPGHAFVEGPKSKAAKRKMSKMAEWVRKPVGRS